MAGYNWNAGKSNNAVNAEEIGLLTKSQLSAWQKRAVEAGKVQPREWHHTSKFFNKTDYYDPADFDDMNPKDFPVVKKAKKVKFEDFVVFVEEFKGTKRFPGAAKYETYSRKKGWFRDDFQRYGGAYTERRAVFTADSLAHEASGIVFNKLGRFMKKSIRKERGEDYR